MRVSSCRVAQNSSIHFPGQQAPIKYISLPFFQSYMCVLGVRFLSSLFFILRKNTILEKFSLTIVASGGSFCSGWELQTRSLRLLGSGDAGFSASNFYGIYTCISHYRGVFSNGGRMEMVHCVPLLLFLEGVPTWAGSIGSVFWDCNWGCQGVSREEKETKIKGSRRREEKAGMS